MKRAILQVDRVLRRTLPLVGALKWRALQAARFGEPEIRLLRYLVDPTRAAVDIGAAEGVYAFYLQRLAQRCIAFEPLDVLAGLSGLLANCLPNLLIEIGGADRGGSLAEVRRRLDPLGYIGLRVDDRGLLKVLAQDAELTGSPNVIFMPMNASLALTGRLDCPS
jgi:hypothetical protein